MMMGLENMYIGSKGAEPSTAQTETYPHGDSARQFARSSWSSIFLKREHLEEGINLSCSPRTSSYTGALATILDADDSKDACFFSHNSQVMDARCEIDVTRAFKRRTNDDSRLDPAERNDVNQKGVAIRPRRRAVVSKLGRFNCPPVLPSSHLLQQSSPGSLDDHRFNEEFRISSILRSRDYISTSDDIDEDDQHHFLTSPPWGRALDPSDFDGGFDGDDESSVMEGLTVQLTEADFQTPGLTPNGGCWKRSHHSGSGHVSLRSRWLPRRFHEGHLDDEDYDSSLAPPEQLTTIEEFNKEFSKAAAKGDRGRSDCLWRELCAKGIPPNVALLNAYTRALTKTLCHPDEAENVAREVCLAGDLSPNSTTYTLLTEARLRYEQIFSEI